jgi:hypothetical protein
MIPSKREERLEAWEVAALRVREETVRASTVNKSNRKKKFPGSNTSNLLFWRCFGFPFTKRFLLGSDAKPGRG